MASFAYERQYILSSEQDLFVLVDISDPAHFEKFVDHSRIDGFIYNSVRKGKYKYQKLCMAKRL